MVSLRFPFSFPQPPKLPGNGGGRARSRFFSAAACSVAAAAGASVIASQNSSNKFLHDALNFWLNGKGSLPGWGSLSLSADAPVTEKKTGFTFPSTLGDSRRLLGIGLRRKRVLGLKNIDVYAFGTGNRNNNAGVYADNGDINELLGEKYGKLSFSELMEMKELINELMESDIGMTVRLQIVYGKLSIGSVRSAFEDSVGSRIQKFGGSDNKELLQRFTSQFKDEYKIPRGSVIDLSRERGNVLRTTIDGKEVGSIKSKLLCRSVLDLYIGDDPFDRKAKEEVEFNLVSLLQK